MEEPLPSTSRGSICELCSGGAERGKSITLSCSHTYHLHCVENRQLNDSECIFCHHDDIELTVKRNVAAFCDEDQPQRSGCTTDPQCGICRIRVPEDDVVVLPCSHAYHLRCFALLQLESYECLLCFRYDEDIAASEHLKYLVLGEDVDSRERLTRLAFTERCFEREVDAAVNNGVGSRNVEEDETSAHFNNNGGENTVVDEEIYFDVNDCEHPEQNLQAVRRCTEEDRANEEVRLRNEDSEGEEARDLEEEEQNDLETASEGSAHSIQIPTRPLNECVLTSEGEFAESEDSLTDGEASEIGEGDVLSEGELQLAENESVVDEENGYFGEDEEGELSELEGEDVFAGGEVRAEDDAQPGLRRRAAPDNIDDSDESGDLILGVSDESSDDEIEVIEDGLEEVGEVDRPHAIRDHDRAASSDEGSGEDEQNGEENPHLDTDGEFSGSDDDGDIDAIVRRIFQSSDEESLTSEAEDVFEDEVIEDPNEGRGMLFVYEGEFPLRADERYRGLNIIDLTLHAEVEEEEAENGHVAGINVLPSTEPTRDRQKIADSRGTRESNSVPECAICLDDLLPVSQTVLKCSHTFHPQCIARWLRENPSCPVCRR